MLPSTKERVVIVGAGLAGLISSILLNRAGYAVTLVEKKVFPFHRVCGEYVSNEVVPFLKTQNIYPAGFEPSSITKLRVSSLSGKHFDERLDIGGFGLSRYVFDDFLCGKAKAEGVEVLQGRKVTGIQLVDDKFRISLESGTCLDAGIVISTHGKRSNIDQKLNRKFFNKHSPYLGVKYHIKTGFPDDLIRLDIFKNGYCGLVKVEGDKYCLCYLSATQNLREYKSISEMEENLLCQNPFLKNVFTNSDFLFEKPEVINEISFERKSLVENHILFCGDSAGMIAPLCGNGMAMAIRSAKILTDCIIACPDFISPRKRILLEQNYLSAWNREFSIRLRAGRFIQHVFGTRRLSDFTVLALKKLPVAKFIVALTHGKPFL
jgi:flavin-dependent dehydrogenase